MENKQDANGASGGLKQSQGSRAESASPAGNILKQSHFSEYNDDNNQMSQLGQFAQLSYLLNNLNSKDGQNAALENFKNDKNLLNQIQQSSQSNQNLLSGDGLQAATQSHFLANPSQYLLSQLSQFGPVNTQANLVNALKRSAAEAEAGAKSQNPMVSSNAGNLELDEL